MGDVRRSVLRSTRLQSTTTSTSTSATSSYHIQLTRRPIPTDFISNDDSLRSWNISGQDVEVVKNDENVLIFRSVDASTSAGIAGSWVPVFSSLGNRRRKEGPNLTAESTLLRVLRESSSALSSKGLLTVVVDIHVVEGKESDFVLHTLKNCRQSIKESGVHRFDFFREVDLNGQETNRFKLVEIYNHDAAPAKHKQTDHYKQWADNVASLMERPRQSEKFFTVYPNPIGFYKSADLLYPGTGERFLQKEGLGKGEKTDWNGQKGLDTTAAATSMFAFQGPKLMMGRGIAESAIGSTLKALKVRNPLLVMGKSGLKRFGPLLEKLNLLTECVYVVEGEPTVPEALAATQFAVDRRCDAVLAIGGGSAIDLGKAVSALITNLYDSNTDVPRDIYDYLEVVGKAMPLENTPVPFIAVPTTSGTGSECTKNAVLKCLRNNRKVSIRSDKMFAVAAVVDPTLTLSCPADVSAHVGLDTLCQNIEPYVSNLPNPFVDALSREGIIRAARSLRNVVLNGQSDIAAREDLSVASVMGGLSLANSRLGVVHGFASVLGGMYVRAPHGAICAALLPYSFEINAERLKKKVQEMDQADDRSAAYFDAVVKLERFQDVAGLITGNSCASIEDGVDWMHALMRDVEIPKLRDLCEGMCEADFSEIVRNTMAASSTRGNPVALSEHDLTRILERAF